MGLSISLLVGHSEQQRTEVVAEINQGLNAAHLPLYDEPPAPLFGVKVAKKHFTATRWLEISPRLSCRKNCFQS